MSAIKLGCERERNNDRFSPVVLCVRVWCRSPSHDTTAATTRPSHHHPPPQTTTHSIRPGGHLVSGVDARAPHTHVHRTTVTCAATTHAQSLGEKKRVGKRKSKRERKKERERERYSKDTAADERPSLREKSRNTK